MIPSLRLIPVILLFPVAAHGTVVTTAVDEDNGNLGGGTGISLREAVKYSQLSGTITFAPAISGQTIRLVLGELTIAKSALTIDGSALPQPVTLSGDVTGNGKSSDDTRIINITSGTVVIDSLVLDRGHCPSGTGKHGAAIHVNNSVTNLTVRNCAISSNESTTYGGGIYFMGTPSNPNSSLTIQNCSFSGNDTGHDGGAIHMTGTLRVENSTFSNNIAYQGCAIFNSAGVATVENSTFTDSAAYGYGGAIYNKATFTLRGSTISNNNAPQGGGIYHSSGSLTVETSTLSGNSSGSEGGGIHVKAGAFISRNSTYSGNTAGTTGGAIGAQDGTLTFQNCTISANTAVGPGGGTGKTVANLEFINTIVAGNFASHSPNTYSQFVGSNNLLAGDPLLAPLGDYGGPTHTMPPLPGSPAIDTGGTTTLTTDQRGFARVSTPDIGAAEYQGPADLARFWKLDFDGDGSPFGVEQALGTDPLVSDPANSNNLTTPVLNGTGQATLNFGLQPTAAAGTRWVLRRSPDLNPGSFQEIYRFDGSSDTAAPGITFLRTASEVTVTDTIAPPGGAFYRFEALLEP